MYIEEEIEHLNVRIGKLEANNRSFQTLSGHITTEDVVKAICKKLGIDIIRIDTTPTAK